MTDKIKLEKITRKGSKVVIEISSLDEPLRINEELLHRFQLVEGIVLTDLQVEQLYVEAKRLECRQKAIRLLAIRQYASRELSFKLRRKGFDNELVDDIIGELIQQGILDDTQYAYNLAQQLIKRKPCGRSYLIAFLQKKYIDRLTSEDVAKTTLTGIDERELAMAALKQRLQEFEHFELEVVQRKSYNYLARRGFSYQVAKTAVDELIDCETR
ncbi:MAG: RecX family transcriptional regulator [candidate division Zixibacteria bacterium]|nr:RecX family transcriptional regulator [candidate division Zixibacteria bacterium]